ncbi:MAG: TolC family protein [Candidatus Omnitrophica bacterium]|nr:TolC family protein [Candidatus Omnitrophota bacterium]MDD4013207.1 TolC family protein [Candidatus Omnitrophota bacterium]
MNRHIMKRNAIIKNTAKAAILSMALFAFIPAQIVYAAKATSGTDVPAFNKEDYIATAGERIVMTLTMADCMEQALKSNSEIKIKSIDPKLREDDVKIAWAEFEPALKGEYNLYYDAEKSYSLFSQGEMKTRNITTGAGIEGKLVTGTQYRVGMDLERAWTSSIIQTMNPAYTAEPKVTITQPLFRGFGIEVNEAEIRIAKNRKSMSDEDFRNMVMEVISRTKGSYYYYHLAIETRTIAKLWLERAESLYSVNKARYEKGLVSSVDLLETEAAVAERNKGYIASERELLKAEDDLRFVTNLVDDPELWNADLELADSPEFTEKKIDLITALENAFIYRPDYTAAEIGLRNRDIRVKVTKNGLLPTVDLKGSFGLNGLDRNTSRAIEKIDTDYEEWNIGAVVKIPFGGGDRAKYDQAKQEKVKALIEFKRLEQKIVLEVRDKVRKTEIQYQEVKASQLALEKEKQNYHAQEERYAAGEVSTHDMLDYQDKLSRAELDYAGSLVEYNIALIELDKTQGLTLLNNGIELEER